VSTNLSESDAPSGRKPPSAARRVLGVLLVAIPLLGTAVHVAMLLGSSQETVVAYYKGGGPLVVFALAGVIFVAGMKPLVSSGGLRGSVLIRAACFLWVASILLIVPGLFVKLRAFFA
jgi:hypothetical protein